MLFSSNDSENVNHLLLLKSYYCNNLLDSNVKFITLGALGFRFNIVFPLAVTKCVAVAEVAAVVVADIVDVADVSDVDAVSDVVVADAVVADAVVVVVLSSGEFGFEMSPLTTVGISPLITVGISPLVIMAASDAEIDCQSFKIEP